MTAGRLSWVADSSLPGKEHARVWTPDLLPVCYKLHKATINPRGYVNDGRDSWSPKPDAYGRRDCQGWSTWLAGELFRAGFPLEGMRAFRCSRYKTRPQLGQPREERFKNIEAHAFLGVMVLREAAGHADRSHFLLLFDILQPSYTGVLANSEDSNFVRRAVIAKLGYINAIPAVRYLEAAP